MPNDEMNNIDKREITFSLRIPSATKRMLEDLSSVQKTQLNRDILITIAKTIHESKFDARLYLKESID